MRRGEPNEPAKNHKQGDQPIRNSIGDCEGGYIADCAINHQKTKDQINEGESEMDHEVVAFLYRCLFGSEFYRLSEKHQVIRENEKN